jgi:hypothetical protein
VVSWSNSDSLLHVKITAVSASMLDLLPEELVNLLPQREIAEAVRYRPVEKLEQLRGPEAEGK